MSSTPSMSETRLARKLLRRRDGVECSIFVVFIRQGAGATRLLQLWKCVRWAASAHRSLAKRSAWARGAHPTWLRRKGATISRSYWLQKIGSIQKVQGWATSAHRSNAPRSAWARGTTLLGWISVAGAYLASAEVALVDSQHAGHGPASGPTRILDVVVQ